jgi:hypothetical protein
MAGTTPREAARRHRKQAARFAGRVRQKQRDAVHAQRFGDAIDETTGEPLQVEVAVQVAREAHERPPVVVAIAVVQPIEAGLHGLPKRRRHECDHQRGQQRPEGVAPFVHPGHTTQQPERDRVDDPEDERDGRDHQPALDDHLDVHQAIPHERRRERQRNAPEQDRGVLHARQLDPDDVRDDVEHDERHQADGRSPHDPAELALGGHRAQAAQRLGHQPEAAHQTRREIHEREVLGNQQHPGGIAGAEPAADHPGANDAEQSRRHVEQGHRRAPRRRPDPRRRPLGKHEREVQEQRRQDEPRDEIGPLEEVIERVVPAARREREHAEKRNREPEEVQRRRIARPPEPHGTAYHDREDADERERVVEPFADERHRLQHDAHRLPGALALQDVIEGLAFGRRFERRRHVRDFGDFAPIDLQEDVPGAETGAGAGRPQVHRLSHGHWRRSSPEHAVFELTAPALDEHDVHGRERHQDRPTATGRPTYAGTGGGGGSLLD